MTFTASKQALSLAAAATALLSTLGLAGAALAQAPAAAQSSAAAVARGDALFNNLGCAACHGVLGTGGANNAADLTRSPLAQTPDDGKTLSAFLVTGRPDRGMPPIRPLTPAEASDLAAKLHALAAPPPGRAAGAALPAALAGQDLSIVVGDPLIGKAYFNDTIAKCSSCHAVEEGKTSSAVNLAHIGSKYKTEKDLQANWILPGRDSGWSPRKDNNVTAVATFADGHEVRGFLTSVSDFKLVIRDAQGATTNIPRADGEPKVRLIDRLQPHVDMMTSSVYQDSDIHNITAYLASLK